MAAASGLADKREVADTDDLTVRNASSFDPVKALVESDRSTHRWCRHSADRRGQSCGSCPSCSSRPRFLFSWLISPQHLEWLILAHPVLCATVQCRQGSAHTTTRCSGREALFACNQFCDGEGRKSWKSPILDRGEREKKRCSGTIVLSERICISGVRAVNSNTDKG